jgi:hypothetical protein
MRKPLFASDLPFIRDCCLDYCNYFDPTDANKIALSISQYFKDITLNERQGRLEEAYCYVMNAFPSGLRAKKYLSILLE